jgi:hypothetical protein
VQTVEVRLSGGIFDYSTLPCGLAVPCVAGIPYPTDPYELCSNADRSARAFDRPLAFDRLP